MIKRSNALFTLKRNRLQKHLLSAILVVSLLVSFEAAARSHSCNTDCQALFKELSFGSPLIGLFYLIAPVFGVIVLFGDKAKKRESASNAGSSKTGKLFYFLAGLSFLIILVAEFSRS